MKKMVLMLLCRLLVMPSLIAQGAVEEEVRQTFVMKPGHASTCVSTGHKALLEMEKYVA